MVIYSVSIKLMPHIEEAWLQWMHNEHMQAVLDTQCFNKCELLKLAEPIDDDGVTYIAQYETDSHEKVNTYIEQFAPALREAGYARFGNQFIAFRTILHRVNPPNTLQ
jgi:hypothetical protein